MAYTDKHPKKSYQLFIGTYTDYSHSRGIYSISFDTAQQSFALLGSSYAGINPSFLALYDDCIYTANEVTETGLVAAFAIEKDGVSLRPLGVAKSPGSSTCHIAIKHKGPYLYGSNYGSGNVFGIKLAKDGSFTEQVAFCQHEGHGPNKNRQEGPHAHSTGVSPDEHHLIAADLGCDELRVYKINVDGELVLVQTVATPPGEGPRHFVFHPDRFLVYVLAELGNNVLTYRWSESKSDLTLIDHKSTLPEGFEGESIAADIHLSHDARFLYVSNRGHDSITVFSLDEEGIPCFCNSSPSGGKSPRNFWIAPSGSHLLVANQDSDNIVAFPRDTDTGLLGPAVAEISIPKPVCIIHRE